MVISRGFFYKLFHYFYCLFKLFVYLYIVILNKYTMTLIEKSRLRKIMRLANVIAKRLEGDYRVRMSIALKMVYKHQSSLRGNRLGLDEGEAKRGFDSYLYSWGMNIYWHSLSEFYVMSDEIMNYVKDQRLDEIRRAA